MSPRAKRKKPGRPKPVVRSPKWYGWTPDLPDRRDLVYAAPLAQLGPLPARVDLRPGCPAVFDQGQLGSCTANAIAGALEFDQIKQKEKSPFVPARLFIYYNERVIEGTVREDSGAQLRDGIKSVAKQGAPHEKLWPYKIAKFSVKPSAAAFADAALHPAVLYQRVMRDAPQMQGCLAAGFPFVIGFTVYESFESAEVAKSGRVDMPGPKERVVGGHAVLIVGYDTPAQRFIARNSWGASWGTKGYFTMPFEYLLDARLSDDFWTVKQVR
jgi:C1A family cysteine protease